MSQAHDKHGNEVKVGDTIEFVYAGDHHTATVAELREQHRHHYATVPIMVEVPTTGTSKRKDENPPSAPREGSKPTHHSSKGTK